MTRILFCTISIIIALTFDFIFGGFNVFTILPPLLVCVVMYWFWRFPFSWRLSLACSAGIIADTIHFSTFGTYLTLFIFFALITEWIKFSSPVMEFKTITLVMVAIYSVSMHVLIKPVSLFLLTVHT